MMKAFLMVVFIVGSAISAYAQQDFMKNIEEGKADFVKDNPNIQKYEFADNFITILGILKENEESFDELGKENTPAGQSAVEVMKETRLAMVRVEQIRGLADVYKDSPNHMIAYFTRIGLDSTCDILTGAYQRGLDFYEKMENITDAKSLQEYMLKNRDIELSKMGTLYDMALEDLTRGSPIVFDILMNPTPDKENHMYFAITKEQKQSLSDKLKDICGEEMNKCEADIRQGKKKSYIDTITVLLYGGLNKGFKTKDEVEGK